MRIWHSSYYEIIALENMFQAWEEFIKGKKHKVDVGIFERSLEDNLFSLYQKLKDKTYRHGNYQLMLKRLKEFLDNKGVLKK